MKCTCQNVLETFGQPGCKRLFGSAKGIILSYSNFSNKFFEPASDTFWQDLGELASLYLIKTLRNTSVEVSDPVFQEFDDGYREFIRSGTITFTATIPRSTFQYICNLEQLLCYNPVLAYLIDKDGNLLTGAKRIDSDGYLFYEPLKLSTVVTQPAFASDTTVQAATITFRLETPMCDLHVVTPPMNLLEVDPLVPLEVIWDPTVSSTGGALTTFDFFLRPNFDGVFGQFANFSGNLSDWIWVYVNGTNVTADTSLKNPPYNSIYDAIGFIVSFSSATVVQSFRVYARPNLINAGYYINKTILL